MKTYHIECMETNSFIVEVEAQNEDEARELAHNDINSFEVVKEWVSDWTDWEGVDIDLLFNIHKTCIFNKQDHAGSLSLKGV